MQIRLAYNKAEEARREMMAITSAHERKAITLKRQLQSSRRNYRELHAAAKDPEKEAIRKIRLYRCTALHYLVYPLDPLK